MSRQLWSQSGEPTWAIDERLRRLEDRVEALATIVAGLAAQHQDSASQRPVTGTTGRDTGAGQPCQGRTRGGDGRDREVPHEHTN